MRIAVTGGTGMIGRRLVRLLVREGHEVAVITRKTSIDWKDNHAEQDEPAVEMIAWEQLEGGSLKEGWKAIINLAGEPISQRWTPLAKQRIIASRQMAAQRVAEWVERMEVKPEVVINSSGINIYGESDSAAFDESSVLPAHPGFLTDVAMKWEEAADRVTGVRLVKLRTGLVLDAKAGALRSMALPYKLGIGGRIGSGRQWISWIHEDDLTRLISFILRTKALSGPVNAVAPNPVTNDSFGKILGRVLGRPHYLPVPAWALKLALGELSGLLLEGQKVLPEKALSHGFKFKYPQLEKALSHLYGR